MADVVKMEIPIGSTRFYGHSLDGIYDELEKKIEQSRKRRPVIPDDKPRSVLQPTPYKQEFWKQQEALVDAAEHSREDDILCCFVFQDENERRRFIVTYPEDFWTECENAPLEKRVFYEVIPENSPCFLYYDLEYETDLNKESDGIRMTRTIIDVTCEYIMKHWNYPCNRSMVINLDSSRPGKFSKHLIFSTKDVAFENNFHAGYLVKMIANDIINFLTNEGTENDILSKFSRADLQELLVETNKGKKLFVDLHVYTKNRHFRIYQATKWGKNSHLLHATDCEYIWSKRPKSKDMEIFINSLIAYLPKKKKLNLLSFDGHDKVAKVQSFAQYKEKHSTAFTFRKFPPCPYPALDRYMSCFIKPGKIRDTKYQEDKKLIVFEVFGNRYCENIGRWHKSNNVYYVVDLISKQMYQKCYDEDCASFISAPKMLPMDVTFYFDDETDSILSSLKD